MSDRKPRLALDAYVLAQGIKTGVYRVCAELFPRLAASARFDVRLLVRPGDEARLAEFAADNALVVPHCDPARSPGECADILLSPFGVAPAPWRADPRVLHAHIVHDLIGIHRPEFFSEPAAQEVREIIGSLDEHTVIFAVSESTRQELLEHRPDLSPAQITVIPLAARRDFRPCTDTDRLSAVRARYGIPADVPYVLSLATLEIRKNLDQVVNALVRFFQAHPEESLHLVLAGMSGWKLERLEQALEDAGRWRARIILTGFVEDEDLSALYSGATCFLYLSRYEGFGLPPLEAMACGTPVICADNSSLPEVVGDAAILVDADDTDGVTQALWRIAQSAALRLSLREAGLARAASFSWDRCAQVVLDALDAACRRRAALPLPLPAHPGAPAPGALPPFATPLGFRNGSAGPRFDLLPPAEGDTLDPDWPRWTDRLAGAPAAAFREGGRRTRGQLRTGSAERPLVSYVTVVRNNAATLQRTIDSVRAQRWPHVEHVIVDGASTDGTLALIEQAAEGLDYFASEPDAGLYDALNKAIGLARGQLICVLNSDDWLEPDAAEIAVHRMRPWLDTPALLLSGAIAHGEQVLQPWPPAVVHPGSYFTCANDCHNAIYATRAAYERSGPYDASYRIAADFKWIMRCLDQRVRFVYTREPTVHYALGGASGDVARHNLECMRVVQQRFPFLSDDEIGGLYHCFFALGTSQVPERRPPDQTAFVRRIWATHAERADLLQALGWAAVHALQHPADLPAPASVPADAGAQRPMRFGRVVKQAAKRMLNRHPSLYDVAARGYRRFRG